MSEQLRSYPALYVMDKAGKTRVWNLSVLSRDSRIFIHIEHGLEDGQCVVSNREIKSGKNIGKKNETTIKEQAFKEADKMHKDKIDKEEYSINKPSSISTMTSSEELKPISPMLCEKYDPESKSKHKIDILFPCFAQPKLDGVRCLSYRIGEHWVNQSRQLKLFKNLVHINQHLQAVFGSERVILDGELYTHQSQFNQFVGIIKKDKIPFGKDLETLLRVHYHIYDCILLDKRYASYQERLEYLKSKVKENPILHLVQTYEIQKDEIINLHQTFVQDGYEGLILRNKQAPYETSRTRHLLKYKEFEDSEFEIIGFKEGEGNDAGTVVWKCKILNSKEGHSEMDVRPRGTIEDRKIYFQNGKKYIGRMLTVRYQGLSEYGVPRFPVGIAIRDYE
jgi:ATP-dependent DNA ligase